MWPLGIVVVAEGAQPYTGLSDRGELMHIQALIAHRSAHTFLLPILPGLAWVDIQRLDPALCEPGLSRCGNKLGTMNWAAGSQNTGLLQETGQSHWCDLVFHPSLQCLTEAGRMSITTC
jgi:hypothetical protein